jgi:hypothetical protein
MSPPLKLLGLVRLPLVVLLRGVPVESERCCGSCSKNLPCPFGAAAFAGGDIA